MNVPESVATSGWKSSLLMAGVALVFYGVTVSHHLLLPDSAILIDAMRNATISSNVCNHNLTNLLGWLFQQLPLENLALKGNLVSVFCGTVVIGLFHALLRALAIPRVVAVLSALVLMVSHSLWWHSTIVENYALSNALLVAALLLATRAGDSPRHWYLMCFLAGLALFNHLQNGALAIGLAAFYLANVSRWSGHRWSLLWRGVAFYLLGSAPFFLVLVRDLLRSENWQDTLHWAVGGGFTPVMFHYNWAHVVGRLADWVFMQFPSPFLIFILLGWIPIIRWWGEASRRAVSIAAPPEASPYLCGFAAFLLAVMVTNLMFFLGYETWDQFAFYLESFVCLAVLGALGAAWYWKRFNRTGRFVCGALLTISVLLPPLIYPQIPRWAAADSGYWSRRYHSAHAAYAGRYDLVGLYTDTVRHDRGTVEEFIRRLLAKLPPQALVVDDVSIFYQAQFMQQHYGQRPNIRFMLFQPLNMAGWGAPADEVLAVCNATTNRVFITATNGPIAGLVTTLQAGGWRAEKFSLGDEFWIFELMR